MKRELILGGSLANTGDKVSTDQLMSFLSSNQNNIDFYQLKPPPGVIMAAALDWQAIIETSASILGLGKALWAAYKKFIKPIREKDNNSAAGLYIVIRSEQKNISQIMLGSDCDDKEYFLSWFENEVSNLQQTVINEEIFTKEIYEFKHSKIWVKITR